RALTAANGSISSLVAFGADGAHTDTFTGTTGSIFHPHTVTQTIADGFQLVSATAAATWLAGLGLTSHHEAIDFATVASATSVSNGTVVETETLTAWTDCGDGHAVFTLTLDETTGAWTFTLLNPIDHAASGTDSANIDLSGLFQATDGDNDS